MQSTDRALTFGKIKPSILAVGTVTNITDMVSRYSAYNQLSVGAEYIEQIWNDGDKYAGNWCEDKKHGEL